MAYEGDDGFSVHKSAVAIAGAFAVGGALLLLNASLDGILGILQAAAGVGLIAGSIVGFARYWRRL